MDNPFFFRWTRLKAAWLLPALLCLASACPAAPIVIGIIPSSLALPVTVAQAQGYFTAEGVPLLPEHIANAVALGQVDALVAAGRHTAPALKTLGADGLLLDDPRIYTETLNLVADRQTIVQRGVDLAKVLRAIEHAERFINEQPQQARRLLPPDTVQVDQTINYRLGLDQSLIGALEGQARWALREGHVPAGRKIPNYLDFIETGPLRFAVPSASLPR